MSAFNAPNSIETRRASGHNAPTGINATAAVEPGTALGHIAIGAINAVEPIIVSRATGDGLGIAGTQGICCITVNTEKLERTVNAVPPIGDSRAVGNNATIKINAVPSVGLEVQ